MQKFYDLLIIGGGISGCILASSIIDNGFKGKIAIIENGRDLGGRASARKSLKNKGWTLNHGSPNFNIENLKNNLLLSNYLEALNRKNFIKSDESMFFKIDKKLNLSTFIENPFYKGNCFTTKYSISYLLNQLIAYGVKKKQIDLFFNTLITDLKFISNNWILYSKKGEIFKARFIVSSSNLILHKRSKEILKKNNIPLRKAIPEGKDKNIDKLIKSLNKQDFLCRINYLIYTNNEYSYKKFNKYKNIHFLLSEKAENQFGFERIIFQQQESSKIGVVIHTKKLIIDRLIKDDVLSNDALIKKFNHIFEFSNLINKLVNYEDISIMRWRASQPTGFRIPKQLQICEDSKIAFCGDWFDYSGFGRVEGAILSAIYLSNNLIKVL
mgnify:CR=1 FL=1